jgi:hypothetical protein
MVSAAPWGEVYRARRYQSRHHGVEFGTGAGQP